MAGAPSTVLCSGCWAWGNGVVLKPSALNEAVPGPEMCGKILKSAMKNSSVEKPVTFQGWFLNNRFVLFDTLVNALIKRNKVKEIVQCVLCPQPGISELCLQMSITSSENFVAEFFMDCFGVSDFKALSQNWQGSRDFYWLNNIFLYCLHNHLLHELWLEQMLQLVIFLEPKCHYVFPSFDFHHFWELLVDGIKREYIINNSKHWKRNSLDLLQLPHMQINVALHSMAFEWGLHFPH